LPNDITAPSWRARARATWNFYARCRMRFSPLAPTPLPAAVRFTGTVRTAELNCRGHIQQGEAIEIEGGGMVRWLGGFDLLVLRKLAGAAAPTRKLVDKLELPPALATRVIRWCVERGILSAATELLA